jgi:putative hydrolase of the HAD superfamily
MGMIKAVVFDLDDTLYLERDYVASGFRAVAADLCLRSPLCEDEIFGWLWKQFLWGSRGNSFDRLLQKYPQLSSAVTVSDLVTLYRSHTPRLELLQGIEDLLEAVIASGAQTGIITDGPVVSQTAKIRALGLDSRIGLLVKTGEWGAEFCKPHPRAYDRIATQTGIPARQCVYIGDNPEKDFLGAKSLGWSTVRLRLAGQLHYAIDAKFGFGADLETGSVAHLTDFVLSNLISD